ncbi:MAG: fimbrillin family protein, partial [Alistipes sp.]
MKTRFLWSSMLLLATVSSCSKDAPSESTMAPKGVVCAAVESTTPTTLDGAKVIWSANDQILLLRQA